MCVRARAVGSSYNAICHTVIVFGDHLFYTMLQFCKMAVWIDIFILLVLCVVLYKSMIFFFWFISLKWQYGLRSFHLLAPSLWSLDLILAVFISWDNIFLHCVCDLKRLYWSISASYICALTKINGCFIWIIYF